MPVRLILLVAAILLPPGINLFQYWLHNPLYGYGLWVPVLAAYLSWRQGWGPDAARPAFPKAAAAVIAAYFASLPVLQIVQKANPDWRFIDWTLASGSVAALLALAAGLGGRKLLARQWFPACFLLVAVPWPTAIEHGFTEHAVRGCASVVEEVLWLAGIPAVASGRVLHTAVGPVGLTDDCSGIRSLQLALMASLFWAGFFGLRNWRAAAMLCGGMAAALAFNVIRVTSLVSVAASTGRIEAVHEWHDFTGNIAQVALMAALPLIGLLCRGKNPRPTAPAVARLARCGGISPRIALAALAWVAVAEVVAAGWFRWHEAPGGSGGGRWTVRKGPQIPAIASGPMPDLVRSNYNYSDGRRLVWRDGNGVPWEFIWLGFDKGAMSACMHNVHQPEVCLSSCDYALAARFPDLRVEIGGREAAFHHQLFLRGGRPLHLFNAALIEGGVAGAASTDWTWPGRLRAAWLGVRGQRASLVHLLVEHPGPPEVVREKAGQNLRLLMERAPSN